MHIAKFVTEQHNLKPDKQNSKHTLKNKTYTLSFGIQYSGQSESHEFPFLAFPWESYWIRGQSVGRSQAVSNSCCGVNSWHFSCLKSSIAKVASKQELLNRKSALISATKLGQMWEKWSYDQRGNASSNPWSSWKNVVRESEWQKSGWFVSKILSKYCDYQTECYR